MPNLFFLQAYWPTWTRTGIPPAWSISVEMSFYLLLPMYARQLARICDGLPARYRQRRELQLLGTLALASLAFRVLVSHFQPNHPYDLDPLPGTLMWFCAGMALAVISVKPSGLAARLHQFSARRWACWTLAGVLYAATLVTTQNNEESLIVFLAYGGAATLL